LYNETLGRAIPPTPTIAGVGLIPDWAHIGRIAFAGEGDTILLAGAPESWGSHLGQSVYLRDVLGRAEGPPPPVDLAHEKRVGDGSDGGWAVALSEMAMASGIGATIDQPSGVDPIASFFGEDQGRYVLTVSGNCDLEKLLREAQDAGAPLQVLGRTGGTELKL